MEAASFVSEARRVVERLRQLDRRRAAFGASLHDYAFAPPLGEEVVEGRVNERCSGGCGMSRWQSSNGALGPGGLLGLVVCLAAFACSHDPDRSTGMPPDGGDGATAGTPDAATDGSRDASTDAANPASECGLPCAGCPDGRVCVWGRFLPECLTPCNDSRDCEALQLTCIDIGLRVCANGNPPDINHPTNPTPCSFSPCSPSGPHERCEGDVLVTDEYVYCGRIRHFCQNGCVTVPAPDPMSPAAYCRP